MKTFRKIASVVLAATMVTSTSAVALTSVNALESVSVDTGIQQNVKDGVMLHAFNWSYNSIKENLPAIAAAGYTTVQTSPVQQPKDFGTSNDVAGQWWKLYQPVSMSIAEKSWLGTKDELKALCTEADKYGIKIICDIVSNHMGNETESDPSSLSEQVKTYDPEFYDNKADYFHTYKSDTSDSSILAVVQGHLSKCPDLNTGNDNVQKAVVDLLKECIDCGVDGFRFDAAKHIETPDDGTYASDYWPTISSEAGAYYTAKTGADLFIYGEILNTCGAGRKYSSYTNHINVTDNRTGDAVLAAVSKGSATGASNATYKAGVAASNAVLWAESHDTFEGTSGSAGIANTADVSDADIIKAWAIVASRKDSTALFFPRPGSALMGEAATNTTYKSTAVSEVNKFHNLFVGQSEKLGNAGNLAYVARGTEGIVIVNCNGTTADVNLTGTGMADGTYTDTITGNTFTVANGTVKGSIGSTGVAVVYKGSVTPKNTCSVESTSFEGETITLTLGLENADSGTYCIDNSTPVAYNGTIKIRVGSDYDYDETINLTLTATKDGKTTTATYKYVKKEAASSGVYIFFNAANRPTWTGPFTVYIYDEDTSETETYSNAAWPGETMKLDPASGYYYYEVSDKSCLANDGTNVTTSSFDLAHSANTYMIISDSTGKQYPGATARTKPMLEGKSKIFFEVKYPNVTETDLVPAKGDTEEATDVTQGSSKPQPATLVYGEVNGDGVINVNDATAIQKHSVGIQALAEKYVPVADVNGDGRINVMDATYVQKYAGSLGDTAKVGQPYETEVEPTTVAPTTAAPTTAPATTEPTTAPAPETYTFYFKTTLGWMTSDGVSLYAYDTKTGDSYFLEKDEEAYPNVYTAEVPATFSSCIIYRNLEEVFETPVGGETGNVYNAWSGTVSKTNNCFTLSGDEVVSTGPYVEEVKPEFELSRVYFDNSVAQWPDVYIYGWAESLLGNTTAPMTNIAGTDIWYYDFDMPLSVGSKCFLFKDTEGGSSWITQTTDMTVEDGKNCYKPKVGSKTGGTWYFYAE